MINDILNESEGIVVSNSTTYDNTSENTVQEANTVTLETIHNDLGFICSFLVLATVVIFIIIIYKFFNMFF